MGACSAELGMVAWSWGTVLVSGSGVLLVGDAGTRLGITRGFLYVNINILQSDSIWRFNNKLQSANKIFTIKHIL